MTYDRQRGDARGLRLFTAGVDHLPINGFDDAFSAVSAIGVRPGPYSS
jgi:hypothetical protein